MNSVWKLTLNIKNWCILFSYLYLCKYYFPIGSRCVLELHLCLHGHYVISWLLKCENIYWKYLINCFLILLYYFAIYFKHSFAVLLLFFLSLKKVLTRFSNCLALSIISSKAWSLSFSFKELSSKDLLPSLVCPDFFYICWHCPS